MSDLKRTLAFGDVHLVRGTPRRVSEDLASAIREHPGSRIVFTGDLFDLSAEAPVLPGDRAIREVLEAHPALKRALGEHLDLGGEILCIAGNHDAEAGHDTFATTLVKAIRCSNARASQIRTSPWFFRIGPTHFEHGHWYDPDNAPAHPLVDGESSLGVHFVRQFIATTGAHRYLNANDQAPFTLLRSAFSWYGPRAPYVIYRYFATAFSALLKSGPFYRAHDETERGRDLEEEFAVRASVQKQIVAELIALGAPPTLTSFRHTFHRLYMDRVLATLTMTSGLALAAAKRRQVGAAAFLLGALWMLRSRTQGVSRYFGAVNERLLESAALIAASTGANLVIFGHTHREEIRSHYANTGSFAFGSDAGRPYLEIENAERQPIVHLRHWRKLG